MHEPLLWLCKRFKGFQPSTLISSVPHTLPRAFLGAKMSLGMIGQQTNTHGSWSQTITVSSSLPLASQRPECAHRTVSTGPVCIVNVHSDLGGFPDISDASLRIGLVLQMRILASRPPVAMREPSG